jgi:hypothetical protein
MVDILYNSRTTQNGDWVILLFVFLYAAIIITKATNENRFSEFRKLIYSKKYITIYRDNNNFNYSFTIVLFIVQLISFAFFIYITLFYFGYSSITDWVLFVQITTLLTYFILSKFLIEKIIATSFAIDEIVEQFNFQKLVFRTYIGLVLVPINVILFYNTTIPQELIKFIIATTLIMCVIVYIASIKNHQNLIFNKLFYFILYLCTLELGPYYFIYYWFAKDIA